MKLKDKTVEVLSKSDTIEQLNDLKVKVLGKKVNLQIYSEVWLS